jgi:hypothetical protein
MLLVCIYSYLKSVLRYKCPVLNTYHPGTLYLLEQGCENPWSANKKVWETLQEVVSENEYETWL